jgi:RNA polymerase sigma factor (TIGR02999 family)
MQRTMMSSPNVTQLLVAWSSGDSAALEALTPLIQHELHRLAVRYMASERPGHILQATALVNEAYLRLVDWKDVRWQNRAHFFAMAAKIMRRVLVDVARTRDRAKRGQGQLHVSLSEAANAPAEPVDFVKLDDALKSLEALDPRQSRVVELRFFGGLSLEEAAHVLDVSVATVRRDWSLARAWLYRELSGGQ